MTRSDYTAPTFIDVAQAQWGSPPAGAVPLDAAHVNAMAQAIANSARWYAGVINVKDYGAKGDGATDDSAAFTAAAAAAKASLRTVPYAMQVGDKVGSVVIDIPAGDYIITTPGAVLGNEGMTEHGVGLIFRGAGKTTTNLIFKPASAGSMLTNDYWQGLEFQNLGLRAATAGCTFLNSATTHAAQRYLFRGCTFEKWKYAVALSGNNNNSEYAFHDVHSIAHQNDGAFLYVGSGGSDQFLNYWFYGCTHWSTSAPFIDATYGGSFHIYGLDCSDWGTALTSTGYLFNLRGTAHAEGVCNFEANGLRWEPKNALCALLYSEWPAGNVAFRSVDMTSQVGLYTYGDVIKLAPSNTNGAAVTFRDSHMAGGVRAVMAANTYAYKAIVKFEECVWRQRHSPSDVVSYDTSAAGGNILAFPPVEFVNCRSSDTAIDSAAGAAVWDATIGYRGQSVQTLRLRSVSVRTAYGIPFVGGPIPKFTLPTGAIITSVEALSPAGAVSSSTTNWTWTLRTTEATPTTVATVSVPGTATAGFSVTTTLTPSYLCDTAAKATLTITPTNVDQSNSGGLLLVKGYW